MTWTCEDWNDKPYVGWVGARVTLRIVATRRSASGLTYLPPRAYCERSFEKCDGFVDAGNEAPSPLRPGLILA